MPSESLAAGLEQMDRDMRRSRCAAHSASLATPTREQVEALERCDPDFHMDGIEVVGGMSSWRNGEWLLRADVLALFPKVTP